MWDLHTGLGANREGILEQLFCATGGLGYLLRQLTCAIWSQEGLIIFTMTSAGPIYFYSSLGPK